MRKYLQAAQDALCTLTEAEARPAALAAIRKVTALGVACLEEHGCPQRDMDDLKNACEVHGVCPNPGEEI